MTRALYRGLLWMHPPAFRQQFAGEMLWIFEQASAADGVAPLFADGVLSVLRQWLLRSDFWKVALALFGGMLQMNLGGLVALSSTPQPAVRAPDPNVPIAMNDFIHLTTAVLTGVLLMVVVLTLWVKKLNARRA